ncbi:hypothetical protein [Micromonospora sp. MA102]|uniref:hypothetical protein n=1 Tax=Micromonospora sp. MA102 TaxID=2952755 RepID=UPI0021C88775|nr:hypothetical protein [Micromonospora sp. MA102]
MIEADLSGEVLDPLSAVAAARSAFAGFRFPPEVIVAAVRCYLRFNLGGDGEQEVAHDFLDEASVRAMVDRMMRTAAGTTCRDLTEAVRQESNRRKAH